MRLRVLTGIIAKASLALLGAGMMLSSCIKDDISGCPPRKNVRLKVITAPDANGTATDRYKDIDSVTIYVFDMDGNFVTTVSGGPYTPGQEYTLPLTLEPGNYQIIAITNQGGFHTTNYTLEELESQKPTIDQVKMQLNLPADGVLRDDIPDLHMGTVQNVTVGPSGVTDVTVEIKPLTYKVNFTVKGLPGQCTFEITDENFLRSLDGQITGLGNDFEYLRTGAFPVPGVNQQQASMIMLALASDKVMPFTLKDAATGNVLYTGDLIAMIKAAYQASGQTPDFTNTFEFNIVITFLANMQVSISVNGWSYSPQDGKL